MANNCKPSSYSLVAYHTDGKCVEENMKVCWHSWGKWKAGHIFKYRECKKCGKSQVGVA